MKRILFVDDEAPVRDGLRMRLFSRRKDWEMVFAENGSDALQHLERQPADLVISDMRMPVMDGAQLLETIAERWPQVIRVVLSGYAEPEQTLRLVPLAHQYLSKPTVQSEPEALIERCTRLHELLPQPHLRAMVGRVRGLPVAAQRYRQLQIAIASENTSPVELARSVAAETPITAKILQIAHSAFFSTSRPTISIERAISQLGVSTVRALLASTDVFAPWPASSTLGKDQIRRLENVLEHASEAMLFDIGYWVMVQECPEQLDAAIQLAEREGLPLDEAETHVIGASHARIGAYLLGLWGLPDMIVNAVAQHHHSNPGELNS